MYAQWKLQDNIGGQCFLNGARWKERALVLKH